MVVGNIDQLLFVELYCFLPNVLDALKNPLARDDTAQAPSGFPGVSCGGRPKTPADIRRLIREMSVANPPSGAPWIHGELLKLGVDVGQTTVAKYMARHLCEDLLAFGS